MRRTRETPRRDWQAAVESVGLTWHTAGGVPYWDESACYVFAPREIDLLERATDELNRMCLEVAGMVIDRGLWHLVGVPEEFGDFVRDSWERDGTTIYGRFDLAFDGSGPPKLLEFNADTPTGLLEAAVAQWRWLKDVHPNGDQFNAIHDRLIEAWRAAGPAGTLHVAGLLESAEDGGTAAYMTDVATQAGWRPTMLDLADVGWDGRKFVDLDGRDVFTAFKLYPWEWLFAEEFGRNLPETGTRWFEPPWKAVLSTKAVLPLLWQTFPESDYLLPAAWSPEWDRYVEKPIHGREGAGVRLVSHGSEAARGADPPHEADRCVYQQAADLFHADGRYAVIGSWTVNGWSCGIGVREDENPVTGNTSRFVPHRIG